MCTRKECIYCCFCSQCPTSIKSNLCVHACMLSRFSHVQLFETLWTVACQIPQTMGFARQESLIRQVWPLCMFDRNCMWNCPVLDFSCLEGFFFNYKFSTTSDWSVQDVCFILIKSWQVVYSRNSHFLLLLLLLICWYIAVHSVLLWYFVSLCNWFSFTFFHFLILFMWLTSFLLGEPGYRLINFIIFKKSWFHWSFLLFLSFISCLLLTLGFYISYFYNYFRREVIYLRIFLFFEEVFITMNFSNWFCCFPYSLK